jgi:hypothetical protein
MLEILGHGFPEAQQLVFNLLPRNSDGPNRIREHREQSMLFFKKKLNKEITATRKQKKNKTKEEQIEIE